MCLPKLKVKFNLILDGGDKDELMKEQMGKQKNSIMIYSKLMKATF